MVRTKGGLSAAEAKRRALDGIANGLSVPEAMKAAGGRTPKVYYLWRSEDPAFRAAVEKIRKAHEEAEDRGLEKIDGTIGFAEWRKKFLKRDTYPHQQAWIDLLEDREPEILPGWHLEMNRPDRLIINTPPFHAKTQTITVDYTVYKLCLNPNYRVVLLSQTSTFAKRFLYQIKLYLTSPQYRMMQQTFAPAGGFKGEKWSETAIYIAGRDSTERDPSVQSLGWGGQIQGARADLIICDDVSTLRNVGQSGEMAYKVSQDLASRVKDGKILFVGTRVGADDLYAYLLNGENFTSGKSPWTHLRQPAVSHFAEDPRDWVTLWPRTTEPLDENSPPAGEDGTYAAWDGPALAKVRAENPAKSWALLYQQETIPADATFDPMCVWGSVNRMRKPGPLKAGAVGHPKTGMEGQYVIAAMDPAMTGDTFTLVGAVDRGTKMRRIMNCWVQPSPSPKYIRDLIKDVTEQYGVHEWVIESNAFQLFLVYDEEIQNYLRNRGVKLTPHYTSNNKQDPDFGVASTAVLFGTTRRSGENQDHKRAFNKDNLIELPDPDKSQGTQVLIDELLTWQPGFRGKELRQDGPMAMWFFELRARDILGFRSARKQNYRDSMFLTSGDLEERRVISIADWRRGSSVEWAS